MIGVRARPLQFVVGVADGVQVDAQGDGDLAHGRHLVAGPEHARAHHPQELLAQLHIDRDPRSLDPQRAQQLLPCMHTLIQCTYSGAVKEKPMGLSPRSGRHGRRRRLAPCL